MITKQGWWLSRMSFLKCIPENKDSWWTIPQFKVQLSLYRCWYTTTLQVKSPFYQKQQESILRKFIIISMQKLAQVYLNTDIPMMGGSGSVG